MSKEAGGLPRQMASVPKPRVVRPTCRLLSAFFGSGLKAADVRSANHPSYDGFAELVVYEERTSCLRPDCRRRSGNVVVIPCKEPPSIGYCLAHSLGSDDCALHCLSSGGIAAGSLQDSEVCK